ncbi:MAG: 2-phospho-L-lactate guanylyltransferase [Candidatus Dormibacteraceae bacterium]
MPRPEIWAVVLIKDFESAKQRLSSALSPLERRQLAVENARRALLAAAAGADHALAVCGSPEAAELSRSLGMDTLLEEHPDGQNGAAERGLSHCLDQGADAVMVISSDLPLIDAAAVSEFLAEFEPAAAPLVLVAPALGRGGTNAILLAPPGCVGMHFGEDSLSKFEADARSRGVSFRRLPSERLELDLDEPSDLETLAAR